MNSRMHLFFADDSRQPNPSRAGMGPMVAIGGFHIPSENVRDLEHAVNKCCSQHGFPDGEEFKWSPGRELWMRDYLIGEPRQRFYLSVLNLVLERGGQACVVIEDERKSPATGGQVPHYEDATCLFLERANRRMRTIHSQGVVIVDRPGGNQQTEDDFLANCLETLLSGTAYTDFDRIALNVLSTSSRLIRLLQIADLIVGCTTAFVSGEPRYSGPVFDAGILPLLVNSGGRVGGIGLKLHPDLLYANLYHWLLGDTYIPKEGSRYPLPQAKLPYYSSPESYDSAHHTRECR